jgi:IS30 family transposase
MTLSPHGEEATMSESRSRTLSDEDKDAYERILRLKEAEKKELEQSNLELMREVKVAQTRIRENEEAINDANYAIAMILKSLGKKADTVGVEIREKDQQDSKLLMGKKGENNASALIRREAIAILKAHPGERFSVRQVLSKIPCQNQILAASKHPKSLVYQALTHDDALKSELTGTGRLFYWPQEGKEKAKDTK